MLATKTNAKEKSATSPKPESKKGVAEEAAPQIQLNPLWHGLATHVGNNAAAGAGDPSPIQRKPSHPTSTPYIQRMCAECEEELNADTETPIQTKLTVGAPDDPYEKEADAVADKVMRMPVGGNQNQLQEDAPSIQSKSFNIPPIQRLCAECTEELDEGSTPSVQSKSDGKPAQPVVPSSVSTTINSPGSGSPLNESVRSRVEPVLDADLSNVRVHESMAAQDASHSLNAKAFTHQNNIFLGRGQSASDAQLMAHEATHTVQQSSSVFKREIAHAETSEPVLMRIPETAGEMRLGRELELEDTELRDVLEAYLNNADYAGIDSEFGEDSSLSLTFSDILSRDIPPTLESLDALDDEVHSQLIDDYYSNILSLLLESFDARDTTSYSTQFQQVSGTYRNLAFLYQWERDYPNYIPPEGEASDWFHNRTLIFLEYARDTEGVGFATVLAAMAAEFESSAWEDVEGPVGTASVTIESPV